MSAARSLAALALLSLSVAHAAAAQSRAVAHPSSGAPPPIFHPHSSVTHRAQPAAGAAPAANQLVRATNGSPAPGAGGSALVGPQGAPIGATTTESNHALLVPSPQQPLGDALLANPTVRITIRTIAAQRIGEALDIDGRLSLIDRDLRSFAAQFSYRNYRLLEAQTFELDFRSIAQLELPGGRALAVEPRELGPDGRVKVHLELLGLHPEHAPRMRTDYSIPRGRTLLVGGSRIDPAVPESGTLLIAITQGD